MKALVCANCGRVLVEVKKGRISNTPFEITCTDCDKQENFQKQARHEPTDPRIIELRKMMGM